MVKRGEKKQVVGRNQGAGGQVEAWQITDSLFPQIFFPDGKKPTVTPIKPW